MYPLDTAGGQSLKSMRSDVRFLQDIDILEEHPGHIKGDIPLADNYSVFAPSQVRRKAGVFWEAIVPSDELSSRVDPLQTRLPGDAEFLVLGCAVGKDNGVVVTEESG